MFFGTTSFILFVLPLEARADQDRRHPWSLFGMTFPTHGSIPIEADEAR